MAGSVVGILLLGVLAVLVVASLSPIIQPVGGGADHPFQSHRGRKGSRFGQHQIEPRPRRVPLRLPFTSARKALSLPR